MSDFYEPRQMHQIKGLSGLFPGPVVDGGRRAWDWNVNSRQAAEQRYYGGLWDVFTLTENFTLPFPGLYTVGGPDREYGRFG